MPVYRLLQYSCAASSFPHTPRPSSRPIIRQRPNIHRIRTQSSPIARLFSRVTVRIRARVLPIPKSKPPALLRSTQAARILHCNTSSSRTREEPNGDIRIIDEQRRGPVLREDRVGSLAFGAGHEYDRGTVLSEVA